MTEAVLEISVTAFKAKCLELFKQLEARRYDKVVVTRRGKRTVGGVRLVAESAEADGRTRE